MTSLKPIQAEGVPGISSAFFLQTGKPTRLYQGQTLKDWQGNIKIIDPSRSESTQYIPGLIQIVKDSDVPEKTRSQAAYVLARMGTRAKHVIPDFIQLMETEKKTLFWILKSFEIFGNNAFQAGDRVRTIIESPESTLPLKQAALEALIKIGPEYPRTVPTLIRVITVPVVKTGSAKEYSDRIELAVQGAQGIAAIGLNASASFPFLLRQIEHPNVMLRMECVNAIASMSTRAEQAVPMLLELMLSDPSLAVRDASGKALGKMGSASLPGLFSLLDEPSAETKMQALVALQLTGLQEEKIQLVLVKKLGDKDARIRVKAASVIWELFENSKMILPVLLQEVSNPERRVRTESVLLLTRMGNSASSLLPELELLKNDSRAYVRVAAKKAIAGIQKKTKK